MGAIAIRCPECGATIPAAPNADIATCEYCGTRSQVRRRTRFFEVAQPPPPRPQGQALPVAMQQHSARWKAGIFIVPVFVVGMIAFSVFMQRKAMQGPESLRKPQWDGIYGAALVDADGDGVVDIVGRAEVLQPEHRAMLGAWHGTTGKRMWVTAPIGLRADTVNTPLGVAGDAVFTSDGAGGVSAFALLDGTPRWTIKLNEKVEQFCSGPEGKVLARTADDKLHPITIADGSLASAIEGPCVPVPNDSYRGDRTNWEVWTWHGDNADQIPREKIEGMSASEALHHRQSGVTVALGEKKPGTRVPMIASYRWPPDEVDIDALRRRADQATDANERMARLREVREAENARGDRVPEVLWTAPVPGVDPLTVDEGAPEPEHAAIDADLFVVAYEISSTDEFRLAAFAIADGRRVWDVAVPGDRPMTTLELSPTHVLVSRWDGLMAFDRATGTLSFTIN